METRRVSTPFQVRWSDEIGKAGAVNRTTWENEEGEDVLKKIVNLQEKGYLVSRV